MPNWSLCERGEAVASIRSAGIAGRVRPRHRIRAPVRALRRGTAEFSGIAGLPARGSGHYGAAGVVAGIQLGAYAVALRPPAIQALARWLVDLRGDGTAHIAEDLVVTGQAAHEWREHYQTPGERQERYAKVWKGRFAGAELEGWQMDVGDRNQPVAVTAVVNVPHFGEIQGPGKDYLPTSSREADFTRTYARLGERRWPLVLGYPWHHEEQVTYRLPAGARLVRAPSSRKIASPFGSFTLTVEDGEASGGITIKSELVVDKNRVSRMTTPPFAPFCATSTQPCRNAWWSTLGGRREEARTVDTAVPPVHRDRLRGGAARAALARWDLAERARLAGFARWSNNPRRLRF